jgi:hypothetical protein
VNHRATCRRPDEREHRRSLSSGEVSITTVCRSCGMSHTRIADGGDDIDDDQPESRPARRGWPFDHRTRREPPCCGVMETILGAVIALVSVAGTQWWQARRENARAERDERRDRAHQSYEHRRAAYLAFLEAVYLLQNRETDDSGRVIPVPEDDTLINNLFALHLLIRVYGTEEVAEEAGLAIDEILHYIFGSADPAMAGHFSNVIRMVRLDLGIDAVPAPPATPGTWLVPRDRHRNGGASDARSSSATGTCATGRSMQALQPPRPATSRSPASPRHQLVSAFPYARPRILPSSCSIGLVLRPRCVATWTSIGRQRTPREHR